MTENPTISKPVKTRRKAADLEAIVLECQNILSKFGTRMSLRQIYYQLVTKQIIPNNQNEYKNLSALLVKARKFGHMNYEDIEDRTRTHHTMLSQDFEEIPDAVETMIQMVTNDTYRIPHMVYQTKLHIVAIEKQALEEFFRAQIAHDSNVILIVNRGYNSLSQIFELAKTIKSLKNLQEIHVSYFGDHDPTGFDIERNFETQMNMQGIQFNSFTRIGITKEQIVHFGLPEDPAKPTDARTKNWERGGCVELDALPPNELVQLLHDQIRTYFDDDAKTELNRLNQILNQKYRKLLIEQLKAKFGV